MVNAKTIKMKSTPVYDDGAFLRAFELMWPHRENPKHSLEAVVNILNVEFGGKAKTVCDVLIPPTSDITLGLNREGDNK